MLAIVSFVACSFWKPSLGVALAVGVLVGGLLAFIDWYASRGEDETS